MQVTDTLEQHNRIIASLIFFALLFAGFISCSDLSQKQASQIDKALSDSLTSTTESWGVDMTFIEEGFKKLHLTGSYSATYTTEDTSNTRIKGPINIQVFDTTGSITTWVSSNRAIYHSNEAIFELFGNVQVDTEDDKHLESEYLKWLQNTTHIETPKFVIITTPTDSIAGTGFEGTTDLKNYTIIKPKGEFEIN